MTKLRLLMVEDSADDAELLRIALERAGYRLDWMRVDTEDELVRALESRSWDIVVSDFQMPAFDGLRAFEVFRKQSIDVPFIFLSGALGEERAVEAMRSGAADYLLKDSLSRLPVAIRRELAAAAARRERRELEDQLRQAQKMEAIGQLAGGIAHDFNNLLTAISGFSHFAMTAVGPAHEAREHIEQVLRAADRAAELTSQLLAFSRRKTVRPRVLDVDEVLKEITPMLRTMIGEDVALEHVGRGDRWPVEIDPSALEQVIVNLAVNARDAMPRGGRLQLICENVRGDTTELVRISVVDNGTGIEEQVRERIFEPFFTTKETGRGTGLGLATCYGIIKQAGGSMRVESRVGVGTRFEIDLPRSAAAAMAAEPATRAPTSTAGTELILVAEDDGLVRSLMIAVLEAQGYRVLAASDGSEAVERLRATSEEIQLLITDAIMPGLSGRDLATQLADEAPGLRVLYVSGYTENVLATRGLLPPDTRVLQKPFTPEDLAREVRIVLDA